MVDMVGLEKIKEKTNIAIGPQTNKALAERGVEALICKKHSEDGFLEEIVEMYRNMEDYYD